MLMRDKVISIFCLVDDILKGIDLFGKSFDTKIMYSCN